MMVPGFKPVGWVAAVAGSAICCYMLSLNVASERADLSRIERQIVQTKQDIRNLQTELGTRGRMAQLEAWNADVLALSAPTTTQFLDDEVKLARFDRRAPALEDRAEVRLASAERTVEPAAKLEAPVVKASAPEAAAQPRNPLVHQASLAVPAPRLQSVSALTGQPARAAPLPSLAKPVKASATPAKPALSARIDMNAPKPTRLASADMPAPIRPAKPVRTQSRIDADLSQQIAVAARLEASRAGSRPRGER